MLITSECFKKNWLYFKSETVFMDWLETNLTDCCQSVICGNEVYTLEKINSGIPQGPILFTVYMNDHPSC